MRNRDVYISAADPNYKIFKTNCPVTEEMGLRDLIGKLY
jgi:hypothetical protein